MKVYYADEAHGARARELSEHLNTELIKGYPELSESLKLVFRPEGLCLEGGDLAYKGDFSDMADRLKPAKLKSEMLIKACTLKNATGRVRVFDATAGLGEDSLILAAGGFDVTMYEYDPVIAALLNDSLLRAKEDVHTASLINRMHLTEGDSIKALSEIAENKAKGMGTESYDVVFLDPMFPERQKSGLIKKKFQLLQQLESPCSDEADLFSAAIAAKPQRIVVKRPAKGPYLAGRKPSFSYDGKAIRYDCYINLN